MILSGVYQPTNQGYGYQLPQQQQQLVNNNLLNHQPSGQYSNLANQYLGNTLLNMGTPFQTIEETLNSLDRLPRMRHSLSLQNLHQVALVSDDDDDYARWPLPVGPYANKNPVNLNEMHYLEAELSRKYEDSKEVESAILGHVPSILEYGKMVNTKSDIEKNLKIVSSSYEQRSKLRQTLRSKLNLPNLVPIMTFDKDHNLVPKSVLTANVPNHGVNLIKLDNMQLEVSNEIMEMIYNRALKTKFEGGEGKKTSKKTIKKSKSLPESKDLTVQEKPKSPQVNRKYEANGIYFDSSDFEQTLNDSGSETDISNCELRRPRETRIQSLKHCYSPRLSSRMMPVFETDHEHSPDVFKQKQSNKDDNKPKDGSAMWMFDDIYEPVPPPAPEIRIQKVSEKTKPKFVIPEIITSDETPLGSFVPDASGLHKYLPNYSVNNSFQHKRNIRNGHIRDDIDMYIKTSELETRVKELSHPRMNIDNNAEVLNIRSRQDHQPRPTLQRQATTEILMERNKELQNNLEELENKIESIQCNNLDNYGNFEEEYANDYLKLKHSASSEIHKKLVSDSSELKEIINLRREIEKNSEQLKALRQMDLYLEKKNQELKLNQEFEFRKKELAKTGKPDLIMNDDIPPVTNMYTSDFDKIMNNKLSKNSNNNQLFITETDLKSKNYKTDMKKYPIKVNQLPILKSPIIAKFSPKPSVKLTPKNQSPTLVSDPLPKVFETFTESPKSLRPESPKKENDLNISDMARKHLGIKDPDLVKR